VIAPVTKSNTDETHHEVSTSGVSSHTMLSSPPVHLGTVLQHMNATITESFPHIKAATISIYEPEVSTESY
jgi:hypothetical protein